jgi:hypothetical protein
LVGYQQATGDAVVPYEANLKDWRVLGSGSATCGAPQ